MKLILASTSPRRAALLAEAGVAFTTVAPEVGEEIDPDLKPEQNARLIAMKKASAVAGKYPDGLVLAADTMVVLDGEIIGKPIDPHDARMMLSKLSGREHTVLTGFSLMMERGGYHSSHVESSFVKFKKLPERVIEEYVATGEPLDKAGAYGIQGSFREWIAGYRGSYTNIMGLPMEPLAEALKTAGFNTLQVGEKPCL